MYWARIGLSLEECNVLGTIGRVALRALAVACQIAPAESLALSLKDEVLQMQITSLNPPNELFFVKVQD